MIKSIATIIGLAVMIWSFQAKKPAAGNNPVMERGKKVYGSVCIACHQPDGQGTPRMNPTLVKTKWVVGDKKALAKIVLFGLKGGEIEIDGDQFYNPMPPLESALTDQQIADALTYVRNSFGNKASAVSVAEVAAVRKSKGVLPAAKPAVKPAAKKPAIKQ